MFFFCTVLYCTVCYVMLKKNSMTWENKFESNWIVCNLWTVYLITIPLTEVRHWNNENKKRRASCQGNHNRGIPWTITVTMDTCDISTTKYKPIQRPFQHNYYVEYMVWNWRTFCDILIHSDWLFKNSISCSSNNVEQFNAAVKFVLYNFWSSFAVFPISLVSLCL